jgi:hypothetical protein
MNKNTLECTVYAPRSILSYDLARQLLGYPCPGDWPCPLAAARAKLDSLERCGEIPDWELHPLNWLVDSLYRCDMNRLERVDDLVREIAVNLVAWEEEFPAEELDRLRSLL